MVYEESADTDGVRSGRMSFPKKHGGITTLMAQYGGTLFVLASAALEPDSQVEIRSSVPGDPNNCWLEWMDTTNNCPADLNSTILDGNCITGGDLDNTVFDLPSVMLHWGLVYTPDDL